MLPRLEADHRIPQEIIGGRTSQSEIQLAVSKKLIADTSNQKNTPVSVISVDSSNYYDRVPYSFACLTAQHFGLQLQHLFLIFKTTQSMNMFLKTAHVTSSST